ncbi:MAG TPA: hypothetical protein VHK69_03825 [Chitinophagaceae bacterium]|jgi:hypothetical protein|nr:hypothetical protein [Chitinophagaceae bacterium]
MQEITTELERKGISEDEARAAMEAIQHWLSDHYPVIATMAQQVLTGKPQASNDPYAS